MRADAYGRTRTTSVASTMTPGGCVRWGPGASCCIFHLENPFSRFSVATGARACKSNARCPLVNLRVNTHRRDNLRSRRVHSRPSSPSRFHRPFLSVSPAYPSDESVFRTGAGPSVPEGEARQDASLYRADRYAGRRYADNLRRAAYALFLSSMFVARCTIGVIPRVTHSDLLSK